MSETEQCHGGGCLCGAVRYEVRGPLRGIINCHCGMCQKLHGGPGAHTKADKSHIIMIEDRGLSWYASSAAANRGFCSECGSSLFWQPVDQPGTGILAGSLDHTGDLKTIGHIFVGEKQEYVKICDDVPQFEGSSDGALDGDEL